MRKLLCGVLIAFGLAACGGQEQQAPANLPLGEVPAGCNTAQIGISLDQFTQNMVTGLKQIEQPYTIYKQDITNDECGILVMMDMEFGFVGVFTDSTGKNVMGVTVSYQNTQDTVVNFNRSIAAMQVLAAIHGSQKVGERPEWKELVGMLTTALNESNKTGHSKQQIVLGDYSYTVIAGSKDVTMVVRRAI